MHSANPIPSMPDKSKELLYELCHLWPTRETRPSSIRGSSLRHPSKTKGMKGSKARSSLSAVGLALLAAILPGACIPRLVASPEIDQFIRDEMELNKIPALSLAIVRQGEIKLVRAYGVRSIESRRPMTLDTPVDLASLSKALTALAILRIEREGSIKRSANVYEVLPGLAGSDWTGVTLNHLLQHRSGLRRGHDFLLPCCASPGDFDPAIAIELLSGADLVGFPGETMSYANSNYVLLAAIIEQSSGIPFRDYMRQSVFLPLGMRNTSIDRSDPTLRAGAMRHEWQWGRVRVSPSSFAGWSGSSRVKSSAADMAAYLDALLSPKPGSFEFLHSADPWWGRLQSGYDLGWTVLERPDWLDEDLILEHTGSIWGGATAAIVAPHSRSGVAVLANLGTARSQEIARALMRSLDGTMLPAARVANRAEIPDTWAIALLVASIALTGAAVWLIWLTRRQLRSGRRDWQPTTWRLARSAILGTLSVTLVYRYHWVGQPHETFPTTIQTALPLLVTSVLAVLLASGIRGLTATAPTMQDN